MIMHDIAFIFILKWYKFELILMFVYYLNFDASPKVRHLWWRVFLNAFTSRENLHARRSASSISLLPNLRSRDEYIYIYISIIFFSNARNVWNLSKLEGWVAFDCVDALGWFTSFLGNFVKLAVRSYWVFASVG